MKLPPQAWYVLGGFALLGLLWWKGKATLNAINPVNHDNVFSSGVNALGGAISGDENFSLGVRIGDATDAAGNAIDSAVGKVYDWTHPSNPFTR